MQATEIRGRIAQVKHALKENGYIVTTVEKQ